MEEYLQYMKTLRCQMNDVEDQAAKISAEEQMYITTVQTLENDLNFAKSEAKKLREDAENMMKAKGQICSQILERQKKIASLESDSSTVAQTLELIQQERVSISAKLVQKSTYYNKAAEDISAKLQQQEDWVNSHKVSREVKKHKLVKNKLCEQMMETEGISSIDSHPMTDNLNEVEDLRAKLESAKSKLEGIALMKAKVVSENDKVKQSIEEIKHRAKDFKPELLAADIVTLEEEHKALLSDKDGESQYLHSLQDQIEQIKGISHMIKCSCGEEYKVELLA